MIKYRLKCGAEHEFDAWFRDSADFDRQAQGELLSCPHCGSAHVSKSMMAPRLARGTPPDGAGTDCASGSDNADQLAAVMRSLGKAARQSAEYVGPRFAEEARLMEAEEAKTRAIYGEATPQEVRSLIDDGIEVLPLPPLPEDMN